MIGNAVDVPEGYALVPLEPTPEMIAAFWGPDGLRIAPKLAKEWTQRAIETQGTPHEPGFLKGWRAMLAVR